MRGALGAMRGAYRTLTLRSVIQELATRRLAVQITTAAGASPDKPPTPPAGSVAGLLRSR